MISLKKLIESIICEVRLPGRDEIKKLIDAGKIQFSSHALQRINNRECTKEEILDVLQNFDKIEQSTKADFGEPNRFFFLKGRVSVIAVVPVEPQHEQRIFVVTVMHRDVHDFQQVNFRSHRPGRRGPGQGYGR